YLPFYFFLVPRRPPISTLFPYTTLFRSAGGSQQSAGTSLVQSGRAGRGRSGDRPLTPTPLPAGERGRGEGRRQAPPLAVGPLLAHQPGHAPGVRLRQHVPGSALRQLDPLVSDRGKGPSGQRNGLVHAAAAL